LDSFEEQSLRESKMAWTKPKLIEIPVGLEINAYACADLKK